MAPLERCMSSASSPAERRYGGPNRRNRLSNLNARRSRPNSASVATGRIVEPVGQHLDPLDDPLGQRVEIGDLAGPDDERGVEMVQLVRVVGGRRHGPSIDLVNVDVKPLHIVLHDIVLLDHKYLDIKILQC